MNRRVAVVKHAIIQNELGGSFRDWLFNVFSPPCEILSKFKLSYIDSSGKDYHKIFINGYHDPIYLSKELDLHVIQHVVSEQLFKWHWHCYEIPGTLVEPNDVVFDCGSAEGIFAFLTHKHAKQVYAFEPLEEYANGLKKTFANSSNVTVVNEALGNKTGEIYLRKDGIASIVSDVKTGTVINIDTIDNFCEKNQVPLNYIKADIEGYEQQLLDGAMNAISQFKPKIAITVYHQENDVQALVKQLKATVPQYNIKLKGLTDTLHKPVMLHAWV